MSFAQARLARSLRKALAQPWVRVVVSRPRDGGERVIERAGEAEPAMLEAVVARVVALTTEGWVKVAVVSDDGARTTMDARHGGVSRHAPGRPEADAMGLSPGILRAIGIANADGSISAQNARKLKQVRHLVEQLRPAVTAVSGGGVVRIADLAAGNAYASFVLADRLRTEGVAFSLLGVEPRPELVRQCRARAAELGMEQVRFEEGTIRSAAASLAKEGADVVLALHACDTATDEAIAAAVHAGARAILVAPCCQAELAAQLKAARREGGSLPPGIAWHGLLLREYGAVLTDAIRAEVLDALGYDVDVVEFVDAEHTPKNKLIRAIRRSEPASRPGRTIDDVRARCETLGVRPSLLALLAENPVWSGIGRRGGAGWDGPR